MTAIRNGLLAGFAASVIILAGVPQIVNGGFETTTNPGAAPVAWVASTAQDCDVLETGSGGPDCGMPTEGLRWLTFSGTGSIAAQPPGLIGGFGTPPVDTMEVEQSFQVSGNQTFLSVRAAFLSNEQPGTAFKDFLSVDLTDGTSTLNLIYLDTNSLMTGSSVRYTQTLGGPMPTTAVTSGTVDIPTAFPSADSNTVFTLRLAIGNAVDGSLPSRGYFDEFTISTGTFITPGVLPTAVSFLPQSDGSTIFRSTGGAWPGAEIFNLFSMSTGSPLGVGPLLGIMPDFWTWHAITCPPGHHPFHVGLDANGIYQFTIPAGAASGVTVDAVMVVFQAGIVVDASGPARHTF